MGNYTAEELLIKYTDNTSHANEVRRLALLLFDETCKKILEMPEKEREYLAAASLLHDIGYYVDAKGHNKYSMKIIMEEGLPGFSYRELMITGCIARYHRGSLPDKTEHEIYRGLEKKERKIVKRLGGILRLADGLDSGHMNMIKKVVIDYNEEDNIVKFILTPSIPDYLPDITSAVRKRDLYEIGFKCQSVIMFEKK